MNLLLITLTVFQSLFTTLEQKTLQSDFTLTYSQSTSTPMTYSGELTMRGEKFALSMVTMEAAYDGSTLYMYSEDTEELTLSHPNQEELIQTNPFLYAKALLPLCEYSEKTQADKTIITLIPRDKSLEIKKFTLRIITATQLPVSVEIQESNGQVTTLRLTNAQYKKECPSFTIVKPEAFLNDLR